MRVCTQEQTPKIYPRERENRKKALEPVEFDKINRAAKGMSYGQYMAMLRSEKEKQEQESRGERGQPEVRKNENIQQRPHRTVIRKAYRYPSH